MSETNYCCEALKTLVEKYDLPFYRPVMIDRMDIKIGPLAIQLLNRTEGGNISKKDKATVVMHFCPMCGTQLVPV